MTIGKIDLPNERRAICRSVLHDLPDWFGIPAAVDEYVEKSAGLPFWAVLDGKNAAGFLAARQTSADAAEIVVMGVLRAYHRKGCGRMLFNECYDWCRQNGLTFLQVKTLDQSYPDANYAATRRFYRAMGFKELECIPEIWGKGCPCLMMILHIE